MATKKEIEYVTNESLGPNALGITEYLKGKENISEFVIAKDLNIEIHSIRKIMYKLFENHVVTFIRKKDKEKGWYICYWSLNDEEIPYLIVKIKRKKINKLKERVSQEIKDSFYMCKNACTRTNFDSAFELNFKCPDCGALMNEQNNERTLNFLNERIDELEKEVEKDMLRVMHLNKIKETTENNEKIARKEALEKIKEKKATKKKPAKKTTKKKTIKKTTSKKKTVKKTTKKKVIKK